MNNPRIAIAQPIAERLTFARARRRAEPARTPSQTPERPAAPATLERLLLRQGGALIVVRLATVDWIEGAGNYIKVHTGATTHLHRQSLGGLEPLLDPKMFVRIHRSTIVNLDRIAELRHTDSGGYDLLMLNGSRLKLSRGRRRQLFAALGRS